jgi:hypothetical protein
MAGRASRPIAMRCHATCRAHAGRADDSSSADALQERGRRAHFAKELHDIDERGTVEVVCMRQRRVW